MADLQKKLTILPDNPLCGISTYKDTLNLATGACTRIISKYEFTGQENWVRTNAGYFYTGNAFSDYNNTQTLYQKLSSMFSHYIATMNDTNGNSLPNGCACLYCSNSSPNNYHEVYIRDNGYSTANDFKAYLAQQYANGTPVTIWYVLAESTTETITVPSGLSGTEEGYLNQSGTPTPTNPIYPTANNVEIWLHSLRKLTTATDTITTLPADVYADGTNATVGLVGNMQQSGTPTPQNPIQPQECGDRTSNLFDYTKTDEIIANTFINRNGNSVTNTEYYMSYPIYVTEGETYTWTFHNNIGTNHTNPTVAFYDATGTIIGVAQHPDTIYFFDFIVPTGCKYIRCPVFTRNGVQNTARLNLGSVSLTYETYGYKIPISSANTTTPVYLGKVQTTRKIKRYEITGLEGWITRSGTPENVFFCERQGVNFINNAAICSHYANQDSGSFDDLQDKHFIVKIASSGDKTYFGIRDSSYPSTNEGANQLKTYLQQQYANGTPVCVWYVLATLETAVVNEPIRKIGDYADTVSGVSIPTITGKDTFDVQTTLKPSEVSLAYTGWHDASVKEKSENLIDVEPFTVEANDGSQNILLWSGTLPVGDYTMSLNQDNTLTSSTRNCIRVNIGGTTYYENSGENYHNNSGIHTMPIPISGSAQTVEIRYWAHTLSNECTYSNIMLNAGSTALPYEPYWK